MQIFRRILAILWLHVYQMAILSEVLDKQWTIDTVNAIMSTIESCQLSCCFKYFPSFPSPPAVTPLSVHHQGRR